MLSKDPAKGIGDLPQRAGGPNTLHDWRHQLRVGSCELLKGGERSGDLRAIASLSICRESLNLLSLSSRIDL
jgi:hypothetical protein